MKNPTRSFLIISGSVFLLAGSMGVAGFRQHSDNQDHVRMFQLYRQLAHPAQRITDDPVLGKSTAPLTMEIYSDFECPFCARFALETFPQIVEEYVATGKVKVVFKHLPLAFHPYARDAAKFAMCANLHGKFWEYHDLLYQNTRNLSLAKIEALAYQVGLTREQIQACFRHEMEMESKLNAIQQEATQRGIRGTPSFWIGGALIRGAQPYSEFQKVLDSLLKQ